jgi:hypothetical protein
MSRQDRRSQHARRVANPDALAFYDPDAMTPDEAVLAAARAQGCTCRPTVTLHGASAVLQHDDWCALLRKRDVN